MLLSRYARLTMPEVTQGSKAVHGRCMLCTCVVAVRTSVYTPSPENWNPVPENEEKCGSPKTVHTVLLVPLLRPPAPEPSDAAVATLQSLPVQPAVHDEHDASPLQRGSQTQSPVTKSHVPCPEHGLPSTMPSHWLSHVTP